MPHSESRVVPKDPPDTFRSGRRLVPTVPPSRRGFRRPMLLIAIAAVSCAALVSASIMFVDRPVATWVHEHLRDTHFALFTASYDTHPLAIGPFSLMASPAETLGPIACVVLAIQALLAAGGQRRTMRGRIILTLALSVLVALQVNAHAKSVFGRTWPESWLGDNPSWIRDGVFGFFPLHGGKGWGSFPSGHTTVVTTPATILCMVWPELRILWVATVAIVITGLIGGNYHFVSDTIGGLYLGVAVGLAMTGLTLSRQDRLNWSILRGTPPIEYPIADATPDP